MWQLWRDIQSPVLVILNPVVIAMIRYNPNAQSWCQSAFATCLSYCKRRTPLQSGKTDWMSYVWRKQEGNIAGCMEMRDILMHLMCIVYVEKIELEINQNMRHET